MYQESASSTQADATNPSSTQVPRGDVWNCANSNGMASSLGNESRPPMRSPHDTGAHAIPTTPRITKITGSAPAHVRSTRANSAKSIAGTRAAASATSHRQTRMVVADVDHGSDTATATASESVSAELSD